MRLLDGEGRVAHVFPALKPLQWGMKPSRVLIAHVEGEQELYAVDEAYPDYMALEQYREFVMRSYGWDGEMYTGEHNRIYHLSKE